MYTDHNAVGHLQQATALYASGWSLPAFRLPELAARDAVRRIWGTSSACSKLGHWLQIGQRPVTDAKIQIDGSKYPKRSARRENSIERLGPNPYPLYGMNP
jgi:hypothetical protein